MTRRAFRTLAILAAPLLLSACLLLPGKFSSAMSVEKDGRFAFSYQGEIQLIGLQAMLDKAKKAESPQKFDPSSCFDQETGEERTCSKEEVAEQRKTWDEQQASKAREDAQMKGMMSGLLGGIDPDEPGSIDQFARNLERIEGWRSVRHIGDGVFMVDYAAAGTLDRDFVFPVIPGYALGEPVFHAQRWKDGRLKITAPALKNGGTSLFSIFGKSFPIGEMDKGDGPKMKPVDGRFTLDTDAEILTNNTEEGPSTVNGRKVMEWKVETGSVMPPESLLRLNTGK